MRSLTSHAGLDPAIHETHRRIQVVRIFVRRLIMDARVKPGDYSEERAGRAAYSPHVLNASSKARVPGVPFSIARIPRLPVV